MPWIFVHRSNVSRDILEFLIKKFFLSDFPRPLWDIFFTLLADQDSTAYVLHIWKPHTLDTGQNSDRIQPGTLELQDSYLQKSVFKVGPHSMSANARGYSSYGIEDLYDAPELGRIESHKLQELVQSDILRYSMRNVQQNRIKENFMTHTCTYTFPIASTNHEGQRN